MLSNLYNKPILIGGAAAGGVERDPNCENTLDRTVNGYYDVILEFERQLRAAPSRPTPQNFFMQNYRENPQYRGHIERVWGDRAYAAPNATTPLDGRTIFGINEGWGHQCTGSYMGKWNSRNNAKRDVGALCCSKFRNGQAAFDINKANEFRIGKGPGARRNEDCGYAWNGERKAWDPNLLNMTRRVVPPNRVAQLRLLQAKSIFGTDIDLVSGDVFANWNIYEQLEHLHSIYTSICSGDIGRIIGRDGPFAQDVLGELIPDPANPDDPDARIRANCHTCEQNIQNFYNDAAQGNRQDCRLLVGRLFELFIQVHGIADTMEATRQRDIRDGRQQAPRVRTRIREFVRDWIRICDNLPAAMQTH